MIARILLALAGLAAIGYAVAGAVTAKGLPLGGAVLFLGAMVIGHDLFLLPLAILIGALVARRLPAPAAAWVQGGLFATAVVVFIATPMVLAPGRTTDNPTRLPLNYERGVLLVLAVIWLTVALGAVAPRLVARRRPGRRG